MSCAAALLLLAGPKPGGGPRFDVFLGYGNNFIVPDQGWFPITCEVQNDGPAFNAIIEVSAAQMGRGQTRRVKVDLPTGTLKRVVIPVFTAAQSGTSACWTSAAESGPSKPGSCPKSSP